MLRRVRGHSNVREVLERVSMAVDASCSSRHEVCQMSKTMQKCRIFTLQACGGYIVDGEVARRRAARSLLIRLNSSRELPNVCGGD